MLEPHDEDALCAMKHHAEWCSNCCIADACDEEHADCAGPEGFVCECPCDGSAVRRRA